MIDIDETLTREAQEIDDSVSAVTAHIGPTPGIPDGDMRIILRIQREGMASVLGIAGILPFEEGRQRGISMIAFPYFALARAMEGLCRVLSLEPGTEEQLWPDCPCRDGSVVDRSEWWASHGETGISSRALNQVLLQRTSYPPCTDIPRDPDDFRRCVKLLDLIPEWRPRLGEVAAKHPAWAPLVENWAELETMLREDAASGRSARLLDRMMELTR